MPMSPNTPAWCASGVALLRSAGLPSTWLTELAYEPLRDAYDDLATSYLRLSGLRRKVVAAQRAHNGRKTIKLRPLDDDVARLCPDDLAATWNRAVAAHEAGWQRLDQAWDPALRHEDSRLLGHLRDETVRECLLLMSPGAYRGLTAQADGGTLRTSARRVAYRYLQRFCGKAETIGPSGPLNLLRVRQGEPAPQPAPGPHHPGGPVASFVDRCLGEVRYATTGDGSAATRRTLLTFWAAYTLIDALLDEAGPEARAALDHGVRIPGYAGDPAPYVRNVTAQIGSPGAATVRQLVDDVERFATLRQAGRPAELTRLASTFERITGRTAWRGQGEFYADRMILVEEAFDNVLGAHVVDDGSGRLADRLGTALDLLASVAVEHRLHGQRRLRELMRQRGTASLPALDVRDLDLDATPAAEAMPVKFIELVNTAEPVVNLTRSELEAAGLIRADLSAWPLFAAADVMLLGPDRPGASTRLVLSEVHHIWPNLSHPSRELMGDAQLEVAEVARRIRDLVAPARPLVQQVRRTQRGTDTSAAGQDLLCLDEMERGDFTDAVDAGELVVREWANGFVGLSSPAHDRDYWLLPEYDDTGLAVGGLAHCATPALDLFRFSFGTHTPRIVVDGVVLQRRRWDPPLPTIPLLRKGARDWCEVRLWQSRLGLPRFAFFITDVEPKPMWLDFESPVSVANFSHSLRTATHVTLSEMLPRPDQLWLTTQSGVHVSEIRILFTRERHAAPVLGEAVLGAAE
ncbi:MAG TPA: hypothetical protein VHY58_12875 [Streptosporangiaceae bacterium]|jgi:hypothetical protein|nr:hypothetical protein [Streptosporangiaceae bacterium]